MTAPPLSKAGGAEALPDDLEFLKGRAAYWDEALRETREQMGADALHKFVVAMLANRDAADRYAEADRALRQEPEQFALDGTTDIQMIQNVADPEGALQAHWPDEYLAWYKPEQWMGPHRAVCIFIGNKIRRLLEREQC
jgi:hypothetical protein